MNLVDADGNPITIAPDETTEREAQVKAVEIKTELAQRREVLNADMLAGLIAPRARFEREFEKLRAYFFTIDGMLNGRKVVGAMFAGECILVFADGILKAQELANSGLRSTVELLHREYETRGLRMDDLTPVEQGLAKDVAGRRGREGDGLATSPKMKHMLEHVIGGMPWKW
jgi:hypothetical protein